MKASARVVGGRGWICITVLVCLFMIFGAELSAQTAQGEIEDRPAPVGRPPQTTRTVFNVSVAVQFNATAAEIQTIRNLMAAGSAMLFDITDGQAEIGEAFIYNNAFGTGTEADVRIYPTTNDTWWKADTGSWQVGGSAHVSYNYLLTAANLGESFAHEFVHLVFDARDEYEARAAGCGAILPGSASCPDAAAIAAGAAACLMDAGGLAGDHSELCWGQGDPSNLTSLTGGNHDATNVTEQSRCRSNRSCWDQVMWSWPNSFVAPTGAPDPAANGATVNATQFVLPDDTTRVVLVLDESGSMSLDSPSRMDRLKVAAKDFVALAEDGTELGIVSYSDDAETGSGRVNVAIAALGTNRSTWNNAIDGLQPDAFTNIGAGLRKAQGMITNAGGVTANTFIVLMTDGLNNRPSPQATANTELQAAVNSLMTAGIPVYVTCTGGDQGLASQCSEIATGTGGFYVDSADSARLAEAFVDFHERISRRDSIGSHASWSEGPEQAFFVEKGSDSVTFALIYQGTETKTAMYMVDPAGNRHDSRIMPRGRYVRVKDPIPGEWRMAVDWFGQAPGRFVKRGYSRSRVNSLGAAVRYPTVLPGQEIYIYAYPRSLGGPISDVTKRIGAAVLRPDGAIDFIQLNDMGHLLNGGGDDIDNDGIYTGVYRKTNIKGPYQFLIGGEFDAWKPSPERSRPDLKTVSPRFRREVRISAAVNDPNDVERDPDDKPATTNWCKWLFFLVILSILLSIACCLVTRRRTRVSARIG